MARKSSANHAGIYIYKKDIFASARCRALTREGAGVYFFLLLHLADMPQKGVYRLKDWSAHPNWAKSDYHKCLKTKDKRERLPLFAKWLAKNDLPWDKTEVLPCLQELFDRGIIIVEGDLLIQPRMAADYGFVLPDIDKDGEPDEWIEALNQVLEKQLEASADNRANNGTQKSALKSTKISHPRTGTGDAGARSKRVGVRDNNKKNNNDKDNSISEKGVGKTVDKIEKTTENPPKRAKKATPVADNPPTIEEIQAYFDERAAQGKPFIYVTPETFFDACEQSGWRLKDGKPMMDWRARCRTFENYRRDRGDQPVGQRGGKKAGEAVAATPPKEGKYKKW